MPYKDPEKRKQCARNQYYGNKEYMLTIQRSHSNRYYIRNREILFQLLGDKCVICGFSDKRALEFDHINGGGSKQRKILNSSKGIHAYYAERPELAKKELQVLCANCNRIKRCENREMYGIVHIKRNHSRLISEEMNSK